MKNINISIVIGTNYGDEGKGLVSAALSNKFFNKNHKCLTVLYNGGAQRGHTVEDENFRHVCHSIGAGTAINQSDTFYNRHFMINPYIFFQEQNELDFKKRIWVDPRCSITTPYDILINQELENFRNKSRHGSCGLGIFETFNRNNNHFILQYDDIKGYDHTKELVLILKENYFQDRIKELQEQGVIFSNAFYNKFYDNSLVEDFVECLLAFKRKTYLSYPEQIFDFYDDIIYEGAQGLMLDMDNQEDWPHLTSSKTGSSWIIEELDELKNNRYFNINVYYVSRAYLTRHGAGPLINEKSPDKILYDYEVDKTNMPNPWQQTLRYAPLDSVRTANFIKKDQNFWVKNNNVNFNFVLTHWNELPEFHGVFLHNEMNFKKKFISMNRFYKKLKI